MINSGITSTAPVVEPPWPQPRLAAAFTLVMLLAATLSFVHRFLPAVMVDPIKAEMHITDVQFSLIQGTAFSLLYVVASLACGFLADRTVRRNLMVGGVVTWTVGTMLFGMATSFEGLLASRAMVGLGEATLGPASISMLCDYFPPHRRGRAIAVSFFGATLGSSLAFAAGGWLLDAAQAGQFAALPWLGTLTPWRQVVVMMGATGFLLVPALLSFAEPARRGWSNSSTRSSPVADLWALRDRLGLVILAGACVALADFGYSIWATALLTRTFQFSSSEAGSTLGLAMLVCGVGGGWLGGVLCDRAHARGGSPARVGVVMWAAAAMLVFAGLLLVPAGWAAVASFAMWQLAANVAYVACASSLQDLVTNRTRGLAAALSLCASIGFGLGFGPTSVAALNQALGRGQDALGMSLLIVLLAAGTLTFGSAALLRSRLRRVAAA